MWQIAAPIIGGLLGGLLNRDAQDSANDANKDIANQNADLQREFAQMGIRWKVEDAKAAGIHPLAALGAPTASFSPSAVGVSANTAMGDAVSGMGQDISRAMMASATKEERAHNDAMKAEQLDNAKLQNELLRSQISTINRPTNPPLPSPMSPMGTGSGGYVVKPAEVTASSSNAPEREAGAVNDYSFVRSKTGLAIVPSKDAKERIEDQFVPEMMWALRNQIIPNFTGGPTPPSPKEHPLPKGYDKWKWNPWYQEFQPFNTERNYFAPTQ